MNTISEYLSQLNPSEIIELRTGDYLFKQNEASRGIYLVKEGRIKLIRDSADGNRGILPKGRLN